MIGQGQRGQKNKGKYTREAKSCGWAGAAMTEKQGEIPKRSEITWLGRGSDDKKSKRRGKEGDNQIDFSQSRARLGDQSQTAKKKHSQTKVKYNK